jgi:hypothetical protein
MRYILALTVALGLGLGLLACNGLVKGERPLMELQIGGDWLNLEYGTGPSKKEDEECESGYEAQSATYCCPNGMVAGPDGYCYEYREFEPILQGELSKSMEVSLSNAGEKPLRVDNIYIEEGGNPYITIKWLAGYPEPADFPYTVEPDLPAPPIRFLVVYDPQPGLVDVSSAMLVIESNHPDFENKTFDNKYKMLFTVESVGPKTRVDKTKITYGCVTGCSTTPVTIDNEGTDTLTISSIDFASPSSEFSISNPPSLPIDVPRKGDPNYNAVTFSVMYCPGDDSWQDTNTLRIVTNDTSLPNQMLDIPVEVKQSPALLEFSTDSPFGYLDFSELSQHSVNIFNTPASECNHLCSDSGHCCGCSIQIEDVTFDPPDSGDWYNFVALDPTTDQQLTLPRALKGGASIQFDVYYQKPAGHPEDRNSTMCVKYVAPLSGPQDYCVSMIAKSQCQFAIGPTNQSLHFNSASPSDVKEKPVVLINNGSAPCTIDGVSVANKWDGASEDYALKDVFTGGTQIPAFTVMPVWVTYSPHSDDLSGKVTVEYQDDLVGAVETVVQLSGAKELDCALPIADAGDGYDGYGAGESVVLDGCGSAAGECGASIYENGYIWFLLDKPAGSTAQLNTEGGCITQFVPDAAGTYEIGLIVYDQETFYQSDLGTTSITVQ